MATRPFEYQSDFALKHRGEGRIEGRTEGIAEGRMHDVLTVLEVRGLPIPDTARARILACTDLDVLNRWIRQAVTATSVDELLRDS
ncbi:hypothetical protein [Pendulispora albinea]|uniref:Transposase n=1 Tax=Pendulispora albinea TaxID=2741071 RepID=A0ABZ2LM76_9BACT